MPIASPLHPRVPLKLEWADFSTAPRDGVVPNPSWGQISGVLTRLRAVPVATGVIAESDRNRKSWWGRLTGAASRAIQAAPDSEDGGFVILSQTPLSYIQATVKNHRYVLEYQDGAIDRHFICQSLLSMERLEQIFYQYTQNPGAIAAQDQWSSLRL